MRKFNVLQNKIIIWKESMHKVTSKISNTYDDALTARLIEKITVRSRKEIEIRFIGGYEKAMPLE